MPYNTDLAERLRELLADTKLVEEKKMMGGLTFMVDDKMCVGVVDDDLMCRIHPDIQDECLARAGCREMDFTGKSMKGYVFVSPDGPDNEQDLRHWVGLALAFNPLAKSSKKKKRMP